MIRLYVWRRGYRFERSWGCGQDAGWRWLRLDATFSLVGWNASLEVQV